MRPLPVNFSPAGQVPDPPTSYDGLGLTGVAGRSQPHASRVAATRPGTKPSLISLDTVRLLSRVISELLQRRNGKRDATTMASRAACEIERYARCCRRAARRAFHVCGVRRCGHARTCARHV